MENKFLWGAATSAYQVEGGVENDWSESGFAPSPDRALQRSPVFYTRQVFAKILYWLLKRGFTKSVVENGSARLGAGFDAGRAADHYNRFREDFDLAKQMGHNAHRFSLEWARIEPEQGKFNQKEIAHYKEVIAELRKRGIEPFVTLWHFTNPIWFSKLGGFANAHNIKYFTRYADVVSRQLGDSVRFWITINEPEIYAFNSYFRGVWPPFKKSKGAYIKVIQNLIAAHKSAYQIIHRNIKSAEVGIAKNNSYFDPAPSRAVRFPHRFIIWLRNKFQNDIFANAYAFLRKTGKRCAARSGDGVERGTKNPLDILLTRFVKWWWNDRILNAIQGHQDFIGLNYYFHNRIKNLKFNQNDNKEVSDLGWEIYPEGLYHVLKDLKKYNKPIYITENGLADAKDGKRAQFIKDHIFWMRKAMAEGADVRGYFHWSLIDNLEWDKGFGPRFGLIEVDYETMERRIRESARAYKEIIKSNLS
jgi:beta-glucosidase